MPVRMRSLLAGPVVVALAMLVAGWGPPAFAGGSCTGLTPDSDPATNREAIQRCLDGPDAVAVLTAGVYPVDGAITVPSGARLVGDTTYPDIRLAANPGGATSLVTFTGSGGRVGFVDLDAAGRLSAGCCTAVAAFAAGDDNLLDDAGVTGAPNGTGVYIICSNCRGNTVLRANVYGNNLGAIFVRFNTAAYANTIDSSDVHDNACDGVTFAGGRGTPDQGGYGVVQHSRLHHNGGRCGNGIPAAGVYAQDNDAGGRLVDNDIYANCGNNIDLVDSQNFDIESNRSWNPGDSPAGASLNCAGFTVAMLGVSYSTLRGNDFRNEGNPHNAIGVSADPNDFFTYRGRKYYDIPGGRNGVVAFLLAARLPGRPAVNNVVSANTIIANCHAPCVGTGYFATRDSGYDPAGGWSAATTNYYTRNNPFGSNVGSKRGGGNWYAANDSCPPNPPPVTECNQDDYQHPTNIDWARNDAFYRY